MRIICYGDSNTWGYDPQDKFGQCYKNRWTDILAQKSGWDVINEGVNGREVPSEPAEADLDTDLYIVMLGTNDCKTVYGASAEVIGKGIEKIIGQIKSISP